MNAPISQNDLHQSVVFMDGLTLAEIIWMDGHEQDAPLQTVIAALDAFEKNRSEANRIVLEAELTAWRDSEVYPFGKYLVP